MRRERRHRLLLVLAAAVALTAAAAPHAVSMPRTADRTVHAVVHAAVSAPHHLGAPTDAPAPRTGRAVVALVLLALLGSTTVVRGSRRRSLEPARAPPAGQPL